MGPHPGRKLIVRSFERKPTSYRDKAPPASATAAPPEPAAPRPSPSPPPAKIKPPGPAADRNPGLSLAKQRKRKRARLDALQWLKTAYPALFGYPPRPLAVGLGKELGRLAAAGGIKRDAIGAALHFHVNSHGYLEALSQPGAMRCRLDGSAVEAVTDEHRAEAAKLIAAIASRGKREAAKA